jgi:Ca2+/Na+ antiporter
MEKVVKATEEEKEKPPSNALRLRRASMGLAVAAVASLIVAPMLAASAKAIAEVTGIGTTFVGVSLVVATTSLPELVTSLAAVRLGAFDLAVGNLFGSNAFDVCVLLFTDLLLRAPPREQAARTLGRNHKNGNSCTDMGERAAPVHFAQKLCVGR